MDSPHALRSKGWAGLAFVILIFASVALSGTPPNANAQASAIGAYLSAHHSGLLIVGWLAFPILAFFLWFVVGMSGYLRRMSTHDEGLPAYVLASGVYAAVVAFFGVLLSTGLAFISGTVAPRGLELVWVISSLAGGPFLAMGLAVFVFAIAHSMRRHNSGAQWLVWLGYLTGAGEVISSLGLFYPSGIPLDNTVAGLILGFVLFAIWMIAASIALIAQGTKQLAGSFS